MCKLSAKEYFLLQSPAAGPERKIYMRIANSFRYFSPNEITMDELGRMPEKQIKEIRNIGRVSYAVLCYEIQGYLRKGVIDE